jgi:hypoxanthine phosphoribosyltransferase
MKKLSDALPTSTLRSPMDRPHFSIGRRLISSDQIQTRVTEIGRQISAHYAGSDLLAVTVLRGGFIFAADLLRKLERTLRVRIDFISASSYLDQTVSSGRVQIGAELGLPLQGSHVLIVEDIVDSGRTLKLLQDKIAAQGPASVRTVALLDKDVQRNQECALDYIGFSIPNVFVVGYGLDHAQMYRHLPDIHVLDSPAGADGKKE